MFSPFSLHPCVPSRRIVIATCRPSPFRCRRSSSWTAPWLTLSTTCTLTWRRMRLTWCSPRLRSACRWRRWRRTPFPPPRSSPPRPPPRTRARTPASPTWDWRPKSTQRRWDCDARYRREDAASTCPTLNINTYKVKKKSMDYIYVLFFF